MAIPDACLLDHLMERYRQHQRRTRGLRELTLRGYEKLIRRFVCTALGADPVAPARLTPDHVVRAMTALAACFSPRSLKAVRTALRSFFRFLRVTGQCDARLEAALPVVTHWRLSTLPRYLTETQLQQLLASLDAGPPGARDRAMVLCLAALGLRPGEVADLRLDDIDWRAGALRLPHRKNGRTAALPLPHKVGRALVAYLRYQRPATTERRVFVKQQGPHRGQPISSNAVSAVVVRALQRAQVPSPVAGAYVLRHTVATRLVRHGASLKQIADVLGHRSLDTTAIYAKVDVPTLRGVALPWPEVTP